MKQYMVIESFFPDCKDAIYERFQQKGRMLPEGLRYLNSWLEQDGDRCFQLMETDDPSLFQVWFENWKDLAAIEIVELGESRNLKTTPPWGDPAIPGGTCFRTSDFFAAGKSNLGTCGSTSLRGRDGYFHSVLALTARVVDAGDERNH